MITNKVKASAFAGACSTVLLWVLNATTGIIAPPGIESAVTAIIMTVVGYLVPNAFDPEQENKDG